MSDSFVDVLNNVVDLLTNDAALTAFCQDKWGKTLTVQKGGRKRTEIDLDKLPIIRITRPQIDKSYVEENVRDGKNICRFYCGFRQNDRAKGPDELIMFEEILDDTLLGTPSDELGALVIDPKSATNDEGFLHPVYFFVADVEIQFRRFKT